MARLQRTEELRRVDRRRTTGSCRSTPTSASRRSWRPRSQHLLASEPDRRGYRMPRLTWYLGRWIRTTDWYPDYQLRLYDRRSGAMDRAPGPRVDSPDGRRAGTAHHPLQHFAYRDISDHLATIDTYTTLAAQQWAADGRRASIAGLVGPAGLRVRAELPAATRIHGRLGRVDRVRPQLVLRLSEAGEAVGAEPDPRVGR